MQKREKYKFDYIKTTTLLCHGGYRIHDQKNFLNINEKLCPMFQEIQKK